MAENKQLTFYYFSNIKCHLHNYFWQRSWHLIFDLIPYFNLTLVPFDSASSIQLFVMRFMTIKSFCSKTDGYCLLGTDISVVGALNKTILLLNRIPTAQEASGYLKHDYRLQVGKTDVSLKSYKRDSTMHKSGGKKPVLSQLELHALVAN